jgi:cytochrome P450
VPVWRGFFGERARNAVYGWSEAAFTAPYMRRKVMGYNVHMPLRPDTVQHVLLDNAANYAKPDIVKRLLGRTIGQGLLTADGPLWREQRRIVAASFTPAAVDQMIPLFARAAREASESWDPSAPVDLAAAGDRHHDADHLGQPVRGRLAPDESSRDAAHNGGAGRL